MSIKKTWISVIKSDIPEISPNFKAESCHRERTANYMKEHGYFSAQTSILSEQNGSLNCIHDFSVTRYGRHVKEYPLP